MSRLQFRNFLLDLDGRELLRDGTVVALQARAFDCLAYLVSHNERAVGRDELIEAVWGHVDVSDAQLGQVILKARRAVDDDGQAQASIRTINRFGYRWVEPVTRIDQPGRAVLPDDGPQPPAKRSHPGTRARHWLWPAAAVLGVCAVVVSLLATEQPEREPAPVDRGIQQLADSTIAVLPLSISGPDAPTWYSLGSMDLAAERLRDAGLSVIASEAVVSALADFGQPSGLTSQGQLADSGSLRQLGQARLSGTIAARSDGGWEAELQLHAPGQALRGFHGLGEHALAATQDAVDSLLAQLDRVAASPPVADWAFEETLFRVRAARLSGESELADLILSLAPAAARNSPRFRFRMIRFDFEAGHLEQAEWQLGDLLQADLVASDPAFRSAIYRERGAIRMRRGDLEGAETDFDLAVSAAQDADDPRALGLALECRGNVRSASNAFSDALDDLSAARVHLGHDGSNASHGVDISQGFLELDRGRPAQAVTYFERAASRLDSQSEPTLLIGALSGLTSARLELLDLPAAYEASEQSWALRHLATERGHRTAVALDRAQVLMQRGRLTEAGALLASIRPSRPLSHGFNERRWQVLHVQWLLDTGADTPDPLPFLADWAAEEFPAWRARMVLLQTRLQLRDQRMQALYSLGQAENLNRTDANATVPMLLAAAEFTAAFDGVEPALEFYFAALDRAEAGGSHRELAQAVSLIMPSLLEHDTDRALAVAGRVAAWADHDFDSALVALQLASARGESEAWRHALARARDLAGERMIPMDLTTPRSWISAALPPNPSGTSDPR